MIVNECVHAYSSGFTSTAADSAWHTLGMNSELVDSGGFHDNATNNSRLTFSSGGIFLVFGAPQWSNPSSGNVFSRLTKNGTSVGYEYNASGFGADPSPYLCGQPAFWLEDFSAGDYMESQGWCDAGGNRDAWTQMCALEVSEWSCHVGSLTTESAPAFGSAVLTFGTVIYDPHGMATATDRIECQKEGYYLVLTNSNGEATTAIFKNGSGTRLNGSTAGGGDGQGRGAGPDYAVDWFEVGDYVRVTLFSNDRSLSSSQRQFAMVYLGNENSAIGYTYTSADISNSDAGFIIGQIRTDSEWIDVGHGHPRNGFQYSGSPTYCTTCGEFNMLEGYHFALVKIASDGTTFVNDDAYTRLNATQMAQPIGNTRHVGFNTRTAFACFHADANDSFTGNWLASGTFVQSAYTPYTNVFVTDTAQWGPQIYRRLEVPV